MSKKLAIQGHSTRGKEVIKLLELIGGKNTYGYNGDMESLYFSIYNDTIIYGSDRSFLNDNYVFFTLEEFLKKFPFRINDFVNIPEYESEVGICGMLWDPLCKRMEYMVYRNDDEEWYTAEELLEYNDNPNEPSKDTEEKDMTKSIDDVYSISECKTIGQGTYTIIIANGYKFDGIDENGNIIVKSIKPDYPKTYEECCEIVHSDPKFYVDTHLYSGILETLYKLLICRKAYWKIAGDELGLGKPWEPDWKDNYQKKWTISFYQGEINLTNGPNVHRILAFPIEELRDIFYENFKDLIEQCKELL